MRIRRLTYFDIPKIKKMISYLSDDGDDKIVRSIIGQSISVLNALMPLKFKFKPETFIIIDNNEILGLITTVTTVGNPYKINITKLIFKENLYEIGKKLIEFVVQKLGSKGATTFTVTIDECHDELFDLFINGCGFRQCASEILWKPKTISNEVPSTKWRYAQKSDSKKIADLYNDELINIYKTSLTRNKKEFEDTMFYGFNDFYKTGYLIEECNKILVYLTTTTFDNRNYILDLTTNSGYDFDYDDLINLMLSDISKKKKNFYPLIKQKKYTKSNEKLENYLKSKEYSPIQTRQILVKDFYKPIPQPSKNWNIFVLGENQITSN